MLQPFDTWPIMEVWQEGQPGMAAAARGETKTLIALYLGLSDSAFSAAKTEHWSLGSLASFKALKVQ